MTLTQLKYFQTTAQLGKIALAAQALYISAPALSTSLSALEKELGATLFDRTGNRVILNPQGEIFLRYVNQVFNNLDCAKLELAQSLEKEESHVRIGVTTSVIWSQLISDFALGNPNIMLSCSTVKLSQLHSSSYPHLYAFILAERDDFDGAEMESICLFSEFPVAIVPQNHPLATRKNVTLEDIKDEILFLPMADHSLNKRIKELFQTARLPLKHIHECAEGICKAMVRAGRGIYLTAGFCSEDTPDLVRIPVDSPDCHWEQHLFWHKGRELSPEEKTFFDFVRHTYES